MSNHLEAWPIDMTILTQTAGRNAHRLLPELIPIFLEDGDLLVGQMGQALQTGDATQLRQAAHRLQGNSASLGVMTIAQLSNKLEHLGKDGDLTTAVESFDLLSEEYKNVKAALLELIHQTK
jgi:HPt (histidine-containing phosphotransfer) domain-containing protein